MGKNQRFFPIDAIDNKNNCFYSVNGDVYKQFIEENKDFFINKTILQDNDKNA